MTHQKTKNYHWRVGSRFNDIFQLTRTCVVDEYDLASTLRKTGLCM